MNEPLPDRLLILVADDDPQVLESYRLALGDGKTPSEADRQFRDLEAELYGHAPAGPSAAFDLMLCRQGEEAITAARAAAAEGRPFAAAFLDVRMPPGLDGVTVAERLRALDADIQIVIVTAYTDVPPAAIARRVPPADKLFYVQKPFHAQEIQQFATALCARWQAEHALQQTHGALEAQVAQRTAELVQTNQALMQEVADRRQAEAKLLESKKILQALNAAAVAVQQAARTPEAVFAAVMEQLQTLGFTGAVVLVDEERKHFTIRYAAVPVGALAQVEKLSQLKAVGYVFPVEQLPIGRQILAGEAAFVPDVAALLAPIIPTPVRFLAPVAMHLLKMPRGVVAPLAVKGEVIGFLGVSADRLTEADIPAVTAFANQIAVALEDTRMFEAIRRNAQELQITGEILRNLNATPDVRQAFPAVAAGLQALTGCQRASVALFDEQRESFTLIALDRPRPELSAGTTLPFAATACSADILAGRPHFTPDLTAEFEFPGERQLYQAGYRSRVNLPLRAGDRIIGALNLAWSQPAGYRETNLSLLEQVADALALALERGRLFDETRRHAAAEREQRELAEALRDTAAALSSTLRFDEVLDRILANVGRVVPHDAANIMLIETDDSCSGGIARIVRCRGYAERGVEAAMLALRLSIAELPTLRRMVETGRPLIVPDVQTQPAWMDFSEARWVHSYAGVPIRIKEQIIGFLHLDSATPGFFSPVQAERLQAFADQAAVAVENARLHDEIRRHAAELEQRVAERTAELQTANERLKELDQLKNRFVANVSHELRTPLANIKTLLYLLEKGRLDKRQYYLATLNRESDLLQQIIEDLLLLSRLDQGKTQPDLASVDVNDLLGTLVADRTTMFADRGLTLTAELAPGLLVVRADARMLMQIATNLMTNAMNYTPRGGVVRVSTGVRISDSDFAGGSPQSAVRNPKSQWVTFLISDTGPGIAAEDLAHLCERFYRGEAGRQSKEPGTGLGLAICKELVERHGGQITVDSVVGQGTTFTVWLPKDE